MADRGIGAVVPITMEGKKIRYAIENDGIINVKTDTAEYKEVRLVGKNHMGDAIRVIIGDDGISEIPIKFITAITDAKKLDFPCVKVL